MSSKWHFLYPTYFKILSKKVTFLLKIYSVPWSGDWQSSTNFPLKFSMLRMYNTYFRLYPLLSFKTAIFSLFSLKLDKNKWCSWYPSAWTVSERLSPFWMIFECMAFDFLEIQFNQKFLFYFYPLFMGWCKFRFDSMKLKSKERPSTNSFSNSTIFLVKCF
jgi:hypothetical protein